MDLAVFLAGLEPSARAALELLKTHSITAAAREFGIARTTLRDRVRALRERFADAGRAFNKLFVGFISREFGPRSFTVARVAARPEPATV